VRLNNYIFKFFLTVCPVFFSAYASETNKIDLPEFLKRAAETVVKFEEILTDELSLKYQKNLKISAHELIIKAKTGYNLNLGSVASSCPDISCSLLGQIPKYGITAGTTFNADFSKSGTISPALAVSFSAPVVRNVLGATERLQAKSADNETEILSRRIIETYEEFYAVMINLYYSWCAARLKYDTARGSWTESRRLLDNTLEKSRRSIADQADVARSELQFLEKTDSLLSASNEYAKYSEEVFLLINLDRNTWPVIPQMLLEEPRFEEEYRDYTNSGRTYTMLKLLTENSRLEVLMQKNTLLPGADAQIYYQMQSGAKTDHYLGTSINFEFPVFREKNKALYETSVIADQKLRLNNGYTAVTDRITLVKLHSDIQKQLELYKNAGKKTVLAQKILTAAENDYRYGRFTLQQLITAINDLETINYNRLSAEIALFRLNVEWLSRTDRLVSSLGSLKKNDHVK